MIKRLLKFMVLLIKGRVIDFDESIKTTDLLHLFIKQAISMLRGVIRLRRLVLLGSNVQLSSKYNMNFAKGVSVGRYSTLDALGGKGIAVGNASSIGSFCIIKVSGTLTSIGKGIQIGKNVGIGDYAHIGGAGGVFIGDDTIAGAYLSIHPENHNYNDTTKLIREQGVNRKGISIGNNCWIGAKVTVLDGSKVGEGCVIAAGAVVGGVFPNDVIIGGVPAKILKEIKNVK
jgi:acetyltransferase-like isoleucine patch superfamily enzyme